MDVWTALVFSVGSIVGGIIITQLWQMNYFKKAKFNHQLWQIKQQDSIKLQSLKKELGLGKKSKLDKVEPAGIMKLINKYVGGDDDEPGEDNWISDVILKVAEDNPDLVQGLIEKYTGSGEQEQLPEGFKNVKFED